MAMIVLPESDTEAFANAETSPLKVTAEEPVSTFSIDVDTASYAVVRSSLMAGALPPREAVRVEEMVNYFPYDYPAPEGDDAVPAHGDGDGRRRGTRARSLSTSASRATLPAVADRPPLNLVFLIDTSGSMQDANKLPLLKQSFRLMLGELRPEDEVAIVTYAGSGGAGAGADAGGGALDDPRRTRPAGGGRLDRRSGGAAAGLCGGGGDGGRRRGDAGDPGDGRGLQRGAVRSRGAEGLHRGEAGGRDLPVGARASGAATSTTRRCRRWRRTGTGRRPISTRCPRRGRCWWTS